MSTSISGAAAAPAFEPTQVEGDAPAPATVAPAPSVWTPTTAPLGAGGANTPATHAIPDAAVTRAARWFWWIAGLSLVNAALALSDLHYGFVLGLAMTTWVQVMFAQQLAVAVPVIALLIGFYFLVGSLAARGRAWAFWVGMAVYLVDGLLYVVVADWVSVAFHAWVLFSLWKGVARLRELQRPAAA